MEDSIKITQSFKKEDLKCTICFDFLNKQIYQCPLGPHYVCGKCNSNITACPVCRSKTLLTRVINLEQELRHYLKKCKYHQNGCNELIFEWDDTHASLCKFKPFNCPICNKSVESGHNKFTSHLMDGFCNLQFNRIQLNLKKQKFRCVLQHKTEASLIEITGRYIILIIPQVKLQNYKVLILSLDENLSGQKIACRVSTDHVSYEIKLPISEFHASENKEGYIPYLTDNLSIIFEDLSFKVPEAIPNQNNLNNFNRSNGQSFSQNTLEHLFGPFAADILSSN